MPKKALAIDRAGRYLEASRINQENLWRRRQIEWKIGFSLWTAIGAFTFFIYSHPLQNIAPWGAMLLALPYIAFTFVHWLILRSLSISSERDLQFLNYYSSLAAWEMDSGNFKEKPLRPAWSESKFDAKAEKHFYKNSSHKLKKHYLIVLVTVVISSFSYCLILAKIYSLD